MSAPFLMIETVNLTKKYGDKNAVENLSLTVPAGLIYCFLGLNGAGKTTTIKIIMGLKNPTSGDVLVNGVSIHSKQIHEVRRSIGYLPDEPLLYDHLTGREHLHFVGELYGGGAGLSARIQADLDKLGLSADADKLIQTYSPGMKKKIALLATLVHDPDILIFDEPTGGLDALTARQVKDILVGFRNSGRLVFFTTHVMEIAERLADRLAIIDKGCLRFDGTMGDLRREHGIKPDETLEDIFIRVVNEGDLHAGGRPAFIFPS